MDKEIALSMKIMLFALPYHAIAMHSIHKTSENSVTAHAMKSVNVLTLLKTVMTQLKTSNQELTAKLTRQSVTFSATWLKDVFQAVLKDAFHFNELSIKFEYIMN